MSPVFFLLPILHPDWPVMCVPKSSPSPTSWLPLCKHNCHQQRVGLLSADCGPAPGPFQPPIPTPLGSQTTCPSRENKFNATAPTPAGGTTSEHAGAHRAALRSGPSEAQGHSSKCQEQHQPGTAAAQGVGASRLSVVVPLGVVDGRAVCVAQRRPAAGGIEERRRL